MMCNLVHCSVVAHVLQEPREGLQWNDSFSLQACFSVMVSTVLKKSVPGERVSTATQLGPTPVGDSCPSARFT